MVTKEQFINGIISYIDTEVMPALPTVSKWGIGTFIILSKSKADDLINMLVTNSMTKTLGIISADGLINEECLFEALQASAERYGCIQINLPFMGILKFSHTDVIKLKNYIIGETNRNAGYNSY